MRVNLSNLTKVKYCQTEETFLYYAICSTYLHLQVLGWCCMLLRNFLNSQQYIWSYIYMSLLMQCSCCMCVYMCVCVAVFIEAETRYTSTIYISTNHTYVCEWQHSRVSVSHVERIDTGIQRRKNKVLLARETVGTIP